MPSCGEWWRVGGAGARLAILTKCRQIFLDTCLFSWYVPVGQYLVTLTLLFKIFVFLGLYPWHMEIPRLGVE